MKRIHPLSWPATIAWIIILHAASATSAFAAAPTVATLAAGAVTTTNATLNGTVNPNGAATVAYFQYGLTTNYGSLSATNNLPATNAVFVLANGILGLQPATTYNYRMVASNSAGLVVGANQSFRTAVGRTLLPGYLANFDVRYPPSLPNDFEVVISGQGLRTNDVVGTYFNSSWGAVNSFAAFVNTDTNSPAYGLNGVTIRYAGPPLPAQVGIMTMFGIQSRVAALVNHQEVWWTINGVRILRPIAPHVVWSYTPSGWLISVANPTPNTIYVYGPRYFPVATGASLPLLSQLTTSINPVSFGTTNWTSLSVPSGTVFGIQPWCRIYFQVPSATPRPIVFQIAARNVPESVLPLPGGTTGPNPNDFNGTDGTDVILTTRATQEFAEDVNGDGVVDVNDLNNLLGNYNSGAADPNALAAMLAWLNGNGTVNASELKQVVSNYWNTTAPGLTNVALAGKTNFQFWVSNLSSLNFSVQVSTNLTNWQFLAPAQLFYQVTDPAATNTNRYYRLTLP